MAGQLKIGRLLADFNHYFFLLLLIFTIEHAPLFSITAVVKKNRSCSGQRTDKKKPGPGQPIRLF
jgi:hypothetical protein